MTVKREIVRERVRNDSRSQELGLNWYRARKRIRDMQTIN